MRIDRLLAIVVMLLDRETVSARELADRFSVSVRTIQRDMESLNLAGIPIFAQTGKSGGYGIVADYKIGNGLFSNEDFLNLLTALRGAESVFGDNRFTGSLARVRGILPRSLREAALERENVFYIDYSLTSGRDSALAEKIGHIERAIARRNPLVFRYTGHREEPTERTVEPLTLVLQWGAWYLFAYCRLRGDYRLFRLGRIRDMSVESVRFRRREKTYRQFLLERPSFGVTKLVEIEFVAKPQARAQVEERHSSGEITDNGDGTLTVRCVQPEEERLYRYLLSYGDSITVVSPERVRDRVREIARKIADS